MSLPRLVARTVRRHDLFGAGDRILIALSGGADSVALSWALKHLEPRSHWAVAGCVHVNHGLRPGAAEADETFCRDLAARLGWPIDVVRVVLPRRDGRSPEAAARAARYAAFSTAAERLDATVIATAHTMDDQAETVLLRLLRGAGSRGLSGIRIRRGVIRRPLLECERDDVRAYLRRIGETFREDVSNLDESIPRNRVRHRLLPILAEFSPGAVRAFARTAAVAAADDVFLTAATERALADVVVHAEPAGAVGLDAAKLTALPAALSRRVIRDALSRVVPDGAWTERHLDAVLRLAGRARQDGHLDLPGLVVRRNGPSLVLMAAGNRQGAAQPITFEYDLPVPGAVDVPEAAARVTAAPGQEVFSSRAGSASAVSVQVGSFVPPLRVRSRRPGDRFRPLGAPGRRKLQDVFVDRRIPRDRRDSVPVVVDARGRIVWVAGVALAHECRVTRPEGGMVILEVRVS